MLPAKNHRPDLFILDGLYTINRAYHAPFTDHLASPTGVPTGAIHGFLGATLSAIKDLQPKWVIVAQEGGHLAADVRTGMATEYKAQRKVFDSALLQQIPIVFELCAALGWRLVVAPGYEADDVIASYLHQHADRSTVVWTTDKDIISCLHARATIFQRKKGKSQLLDLADIQTAWGVPAHQITEVLALFGDVVDNIPGVKGIGETTAVKLIQQYGTVDNVVDHLTDLTPKVQAALTTYAADLRLSQQLLQLNRAIPLPPLEPVAPDKERVRAILSELGIRVLLERIETYWVASGV